MAVSTPDYRRDVLFLPLFPKGYVNHFIRFRTSRHTRHSYDVGRWLAAENMQDLGRNGPMGD